MRFHTNKSVALRAVFNKLHIVTSLKAEEFLLTVAVQHTLLYVVDRNSILCTFVEREWVLHISAPGVQPRICHCFQDILNKRIVNLTFNLSRSFKVKPMGSI